MKSYKPDENYAGYVSQMTFEIFDDDTFYALLKRKGIDITRKLRYSCNYGVVGIYYDDNSFLGFGI